jgi:hypothetical protein
LILIFQMLLIPNCHIRSAHFFSFFLSFFLFSLIAQRRRDSIQSFVCVRTANTLIQLIICFFFRSICRRIFLSQSGSPLSKRILLLLDHHLHPLLHVGHRFVGVVLVGRQRSARPCLTRSHNSPHNGNADDWYQQLTATSLLH